jgi:hypothetical protein
MKTLKIVFMFVLMTFMSGGLQADHNVANCVIYSCYATTNCGVSCGGHSCFGLQCERFNYGYSAVCRGFNSDGTVGYESIVHCY